MQRWKMKGGGEDKGKTEKEAFAAQKPLQAFKIPQVVC